MNTADAADAGCPAAASPPQEDVLDWIGSAHLLELLAAYYAAQGFTVERVGKDGPQLFSPRAGGLKLRRDDRILVVECRASAAHPIGQRDVERLCAAARAQHATGAIFATTGRFTPRARLTGEQQPELQLIDNQMLRRMLGTEVIAALQAAYPPRLHGGGDAVPPPPDPAAAQPRRRPDLAPFVWPSLLLLALLLLVWLTSR